MNWLCNSVGTLRNLLFVTGLWGCSTFVHAQSQSFLDIDKAAIERLLEELKCPGVLIAIKRFGDEPIVRAIGYSDAKKTQPISLDDHMRIGSVSKLFIGTLILRLSEEGLLSLDDPISKYVSEIPNGDQITLRQLGNHTSGLPGAIYNSAFQQAIVQNPQKIWQPSEILSFALSQDTHFSPGKDWKYSNTNTLLLGLAAEKAISMPLSQALNQYVLDPLSLTSTGLNTNGNLPQPNTRAYRHGKKGHPIGYGTVFFDVTDYNATWTNAAGNMYSTITDLINAAKPLCKGKILTQDSKEELLSWQKTGQKDYKYGFCLEAWNGLIGHRGDVPGYQCVLGYDQDKDLSIVVICNLSNDAKGRGPANEIANLILSSIRETRDKN